MTEWFEIQDLEQFVTKVRSIVYNNFGKWKDDSNEIDQLIDHVKEEELEDLNKILSQDESLLIVREIIKTKTNRKTKKTKFIINNDLFYQIIQSLNDRMVSNILQGLVNKGIVESSYDSSINDFIFWVNENIDNKPETD